MESRDYSRKKVWDAIPLCLCVGPKTLQTLANVMVYKEYWENQ